MLACFVKMECQEIYVSFKIICIIDFKEYYTYLHASEQFHTLLHPL